jgi:hypothetical protein
LARRQLEGGRLPNSGGVRPQVTVMVDLAGLLGGSGLPGGEGGWTGPLPAETVRRLACDATVTRVLVTRHHDNSDHPATITAPGSPVTWRHGSTRRWRCWRPRLLGRPPSRWRSATPPARSRLRS